MQIPTGAIGITALLLSIYITNRIKLRWPVIAVIVLFPIAGAVGLTQVDRHKPGGLMACYYVAYLFSAIQPLLISWCNLNAAGTTKRVLTSATMFGALTVGNVRAAF
jgi:heme A synthase